MQCSPCVPSKRSALRGQLMFSIRWLAQGLAPNKSSHLQLSRRLCSTSARTSEQIQMSWHPCPGAEWTFQGRRPCDVCGPSRGMTTEKLQAVWSSLSWDSHEANLFTSKIHAPQTPHHVLSRVAHPFLAKLEPFLEAALHFRGEVCGGHLVGPMPRGCRGARA